MSQCYGDSRSGCFCVYLVNAELAANMRSDKMVADGVCKTQELAPTKHLGISKLQELNFDVTIPWDVSLCVVGRLP